MVSYWEREFTEMPDAMLRPLSTASQGPLPRAAPTNKQHQQRKERQTD